MFALCCSLVVWAVLLWLAALPFAFAVACWRGALRPRFFRAVWVAPPLRCRVAAALRWLRRPWRLGSLVVAVVGWRVSGPLAFASGRRLALWWRLWWLVWALAP